MKGIGRIVLVGALAVVLFDVLASFASNGLGFPYARAAYGSYLIYAATGFFAARAAGWKGAGIAGVSLGLTDASLGWALSWMIGPGRPPADASFNLWIWAAVALTVCITATICALVGALAARLARRKTVPAT